MYFCKNIDKRQFDFAQMDEYDDCLLINGGKDGETKHIFSSSICYMEAMGHYSMLYLNNGEELYLNIDLKKFEKLINKWFRFSYRYFYRVGKSLIINRKYLDAFYVSKGKMILSENRSEYLEGYKAGYQAGFSDRDKNKYLTMPSSPRPESIELDVSEKALKDFRNMIEEKISKKKDRKQSKNNDNE